MPSPVKNHMFKIVNKFEGENTRKFFKLGILYGLVIVSTLKISVMISLILFVVTFMLVGLYLINRDRISFNSGYVYYQVKDATYRYNYNNEMINKIEIVN